MTAYEYFAELFGAKHIAAIAAQPTITRKVNAVRNVFPDATLTEALQVIKVILEH